MANFWIVTAIALALSPLLVGTIFCMLEPWDDDGWPERKPNDDS